MQFNTINKMQRLLQENGVAETFPYIKSLDTIEILGTDKNNGKERVLLYDIIEEYGETSLINDEGYKYLFPCLSEGVIKSRTSDNVIYYTHFKITYNTDSEFGLDIKEYDFFDGDFYLRYIVTLQGIPNTIRENYTNNLIVQSSCIKHFFFDVFSEDELRMNSFSKTEIEYLREFADEDNLKLNHIVGIIIRYTFSTFQAINFLSSYNSKEAISMEPENVTNIVKKKNNYQNLYKSIRVINTSNYYNLKIGKKNCSSSVKGTKNIVRKTEKWIVKGHVRKYQNGKIVYVKPYYKGPKRKENLYTQAHFKVKEGLSVIPES